MTESRTDAYGYNDRNELVSATKNTEDTEYQYSYDDIGNRLSSLDLGTDRTYDANNLNQYTSISNAVGETFSPIFDLDMRPRQRGRVARRSEATEPRSGRKRPRNQTLVRTATGDWTVAYNAENRPVSWTCGTTNIVMLFDRMGRRVEYVETVTDDSGESPVTTTNRHHRFVYDGYLCVQRLNARSGNAIELSFAWDPTEPVATRPLVLQRQGGWNFFYTHDGNKNVSDIVSFQQARGVPAHYEYAPFGAVTAATTNTAFTAFNVVETNPYRFSSEYADDTLGLVYYNYRHYNPMDGRWLRRDPVGHLSVNGIYNFCANSFVSLDLLGLSRLSLSYDMSSDSTVFDRIVNPFTVFEKDINKVIDDITSKVKSYDPRGKGSCNCIEKISLIGHGSSGSVHFGDDLLVSLEVKCHNDGCDTKSAPRELLALLDMLARYKCDSMTVEFVTCQTGAGESGQQMKDELEKLFGSGVNVILHTTDVQWCYGQSWEGVNPDKTLKQEQRSLKR